MALNPRYTRIPIKNPIQQPRASIFSVLHKLTDVGSASIDLDELGSCLRQRQTGQLSEACTEGPSSHKSIDKVR